MLRFTPELMPWSATGLLACLSFFFTGCANACFLVVSNTPKGTIGVAAGNPPPACTPSKAKGAIRVVAHANTVCVFCSESNRIQSFQLSLRSVDIHLKWNSREESSDWQELLPEFESQPLQVDLLNEGTNSSRAVTERVLVPTGVYDMVRIRFESNGSGSDVFHAKNGCSYVASSCVVMADGQILPLVFDANTLESRFASESTEDRLLFVSPDSESELLIELTPVVSLGAFIENGARVFSLVASKTTVVREEIVPAELKASALDFLDVTGPPLTSNSQ
jgi:hypothetical protein